MGHTSITLGLLFGLSAAVSQLPQGLFERRDAQPASVPTVRAGAEQDVALQDVTAAAVVQSLRSRFAGSDIEFKFDNFDHRQVSQRDMELRGAGQFRIEGGQAWLPITYSASYDTATGSIGSPEITFAPQVAHATRDPIGSGGLDQIVGQQLTAEFGSQSVEFDLGTVRPVAGDARYVVVDGSGVASFAGEGAAHVSVQAVLDRSTGQWLGVAYALGDEAA